MSVALCVGNLVWEVGSSRFLNAFFSTISHRLEPDGAGSRFPLVARLYAGDLPSQAAQQARHELDESRRELSRLGPDQVVWDREDLESRPPWGSNISPDITHLSNYFVTSDGRDLFDVLAEALVESEESGLHLRIE